MSATNTIKILFNNKFDKPPSLSIILLDWSVRESFHSIEYLNHQTVARERYEILWIEYYDRKAKEISESLKKHTVRKLYSPIDKWILLNRPKTELYHKHQMYNIGILLSSGNITTICDSDAVFRTTFVESIISEFDNNPNIILHLDELRNTKKKFYPFNYPTIEEVTNSGCNFCLNGSPVNLIMDIKDRLHSLNYGACFNALRKDLIAIGGSDEHPDYKGHICGPYEMTFRLINAGKVEKWHSTQWIYHTWHPGESGRGNTKIKDDGRGMSSIALDILKNGRIMPLVENPEIKKLRESQNILLSH